jgi:hypothetical protein
LIFNGLPELGVLAGFCSIADPNQGTTVQR